MPLCCCGFISIVDIDTGQADSSAPFRRGHLMPEVDGARLLEEMRNATVNDFSPVQILCSSVVSHLWNNEKQDT